VPESDLRRAFQKKCRNVILNHDPSRADYALEPIARTNPLDGERPRYRFTLFNRAGNAIYSTLPHKFSNAVDNICNPLAQSTADSTVKITDASEPNSPLSVSGDVSFHQEFSANIEATQRHLNITITNVSNKLILAYEVSIDAKPDVGAGINHVARTDYFFNGILARGAHETISDPARFVESTLPDHRPTGSRAIFRVVFVEFADGLKFGSSNWGSRFIQSTRPKPGEDSGNAECIPQFA